jgi:hypothetical protein
VLHRQKNFQKKKGWWMFRKQKISYDLRLHSAVSQLAHFGKLAVVCGCSSGRCCSLLIATWRQA